MESYKHKFAKETLASWLRAGPTLDSDLLDDGHDKHVLGSMMRDDDYRPLVWTEFPICLNSNNNLVGNMPTWDCMGPWYKIADQLGIQAGKYENAPPSYSECIDMGIMPICIFDVAVSFSSHLVRAYEVVHSNPISPTKLEYIRRIMNERYGGGCFLSIYTIEADWILSRCGVPESLNRTLVRI